MDWSAYSRPCRFEQPYSRKTEVVGPSAMLWALLAGPLYYWKKGAVIEAILLCAAAVPLWVIDESNSLVSFSTVEDATALIWAASVVLAPLILVMSYRRRGWAIHPTGID